MRIYELQNELGLESSREIRDFVSTAEKEYTASSSLTEEQVKLVREKFGKKKGAAGKVAENEQTSKEPVKSAAEGKTEKEAKAGKMKAEEVKKPERAAGAVKTGKTEKSEKPEKAEKAEKAERPEKAERTEKTVRQPKKKFFSFDFRNPSSSGNAKSGNRKAGERNGRSGGTGARTRRPITAKQRAEQAEERIRNVAPEKAARELTAEELEAEIRNRNAKAAALAQEAEETTDTKAKAPEAAVSGSEMARANAQQAEAKTEAKTQEKRASAPSAAHAKDGSENESGRNGMAQEPEKKTAKEPAKESSKEPVKESGRRTEERKSEAPLTGKASDSIKVGQNVFAMLKEQNAKRAANRSAASRSGRTGSFNRDRNASGAHGRNGFNRDRGASQGGFRSHGTQGGFRSGERSEGSFNRDRNGSGRSFGGGSRFAGRHTGETSSFASTARPDAKNYSRRKDTHKREKFQYDEKENFSALTKNNNHKKQNKKKEEDTIRTITVPETLTLSELADLIKVPAAELVKKLFLSGKIVTINDEIDYDTAEKLALEYNCLCEKEIVKDPIEELLKEDEEDPKDLVPRPPVVCVMGHVDHGKTSLLDYIRKSHVTEKESGGITQAIGAYTVKTKSDRQITFLDTPGHEAFTAMRMRGAQATDIAVLVVAADDGVMPQTIEAINHAKAANVTIIVAVNKIDKPNANVEKVKQELVEYGLVATDWGGDTEFCPVSAKTGEGVDDLLETIMLTADILDLRANPNRDARGIVIEARLSRGRGPVATVLIQKGTLHVGDFAAAGEHYGRVRAMVNDKNRRVKEAGPSIPVEIQGLDGVPNAGEVLKSFDSEKEARAFAETFIAQGKKELVEESKKRVSLEDLFDQIKAGKVKELNLIVKADVQGSVEAVKQSLLKLSNDEVVVKVIHAGVGNINESDVILASASNAIIIGFNVKPENQAKAAADEENVDIRLYSVIYNAIEDVQDALKGMLEPVYEEQVVGHAEIRQIFKASGVGNIAGALVTDGRITAKSTARVFRGEDKIFEGKIASLKRFKDEAKEVKAGLECGIVFENFGGFAEGDTVEAYEMVEVPRK